MFLDPIRAHPIAKLPSDNRYNWIGPGRPANTPAIARLTRPTHSDLWTPIVGPQYNIIMVDSLTQKRVPRAHFKLQTSDNNSPDRRSFDVYRTHEQNENKVSSLTPTIIRPASSTVSGNLEMSSPSFNSHFDRHPRTLPRIQSMFSKPADYSLTSGEVSNIPPFQMVSRASHLNELFHSKKKLMTSPVFIVSQSGKRNSQWTENHPKRVTAVIPQIKDKSVRITPMIYKSEPIILQKMTFQSPSEMIASNISIQRKNSLNIVGGHAAKTKPINQIINRSDNIEKPSNTFVEPFGFKTNFVKKQKLANIYDKKSKMTKENLNYHRAPSMQPRIATDDVIYIDHGNNNEINLSNDVIGYKPIPYNKAKEEQPFSFVVSHSLKY